MNKSNFIKCGGLVIKTKPPASGNKPVTVIVEKKVFKKAVERNLFKRRIRSILTPVSKKQRLDFWVIAKPSSARLSFLELKEEILSRVTGAK